jgi:alanine-synthesizing transaminase
MGQMAIQTALGGYQSIADLVAPGGRLREQRDVAYKAVTAIPGVTCVKPTGALYLFPRLDPKIYHIVDDQRFIFDLLAAEKILVVQGTGFNWPKPDHIRIVFLPRADELRDAISRIGHFLSTYHQ